MKNTERMMGRSVRRAAALAIAVMFAAAGCGSSSASKSAEYAAAESAMEAPAAGYSTNTLYDSAAMEEASWDGDAEMKTAESGSTQAETPQDTSRKLITTVHISAETEEMDALLAHVENRVNALGGYIESSDVSNGSYQTYADRTRRHRDASMTIRIPAENLADFVNDVQEHTNITNQSKNVEDVTLSYADLDSHKRMLRAEEDRLLGFMEQAETIEDMIAVEERLTNVQYQLDSMESQLRTYDNRINYSTIYLNISEVVEFTVTEEPETLWEEIARGFGENLHSVIMGLRSFFVWFVTHIPQLVIWAIVIFIIAQIVRVIRRRQLKKLAELSASGMGRPLTPREQAKLKKQQDRQAKKEAKALHKAIREGKVPPLNPIAVAPQPPQNDPQDKPQA
ncbi:MAG: DUF4349 domain-containing protein [Lachnospiraceae bacterium]|nr:DUF4349 domain-containing protein [Lachnospiraceae bacterium]